MVQDLSTYTIQNVMLLLWLYCNNFLYRIHYMYMYVFIILCFNLQTVGRFSHYSGVDVVTVEKEDSAFKHRKLSELSGGESDSEGI